MERLGLRQDAVHREDRETLARRQIKRFGWNMVVLAGSVGLYYLGFFGTTDGPLNPHRLGTTMADFGITGMHLTAGVILVFLISISWNWVYNLKLRVRYSSRSANRQDNFGRAAYQPIRKGLWGHTAWVGMLIVLIGVIAQMNGWI